MDNNEKTLTSAMKEVLHLRKVSERNRVTAIKNSYVNAQNSMLELIEKIGLLESKLGEVYEKICVGIIYQDSYFNEGIGGINDHKSNLEKYREFLETVSNQITVEINSLNRKIDSLNSEIYGQLGSV